MASAERSQRFELRSISVNKKVTVPVGSALTAASLPLRDGVAKLAARQCVSHQSIDQRVVANAQRRAGIREKAGGRKAGQRVDLQNVRPKVAADDKVRPRVVA